MKKVETKATRISRETLERLRRVKKVRTKRFSERWKAIPCHPRYEVSDRGRVRFAKSKKHVRRRLDLSGYRKVSIDGKNMSIHRIVLLAFVGKCPEGMECRHLNGKPSDNRLKNLRWGTPKENGEDRVRHGTSKWTSFRERRGAPPVCASKGCYKWALHGVRYCSECRSK